MAAKRRIRLKGGMVLEVYEKSLGIKPGLIFVKSEVELDMVNALAVQLEHAFDEGYRYRSEEVASHLKSAMSTTGRLKGATDEEKPLVNL